MENRKYEVENYKTKKRVKVPKEKHIIVSNTHEAIIERIDFERVQELLSAKRRQPRHYSENLFKSIIFCKACGHRMHLANVARNRVKTAKVYEILYKCSHHFLRRDECPKNNGVNYFKLKEIITERIRYFFSIVSNDEALIQIIAQKSAEENPIDKYLTEKTKIERRLTILTRMISKVYNDSAEDLIDDKTSQELLKEYQNEQKSLNTKLTEINKYLEQNNDFINSLDKLKENIKDFLNFKELTDEMVNRLISRINISPVEVIDGKRTQQIEIVYRFIDISL